MLFGYVSMINQVFLPLSTPHKAIYVTFGRKKTRRGISRRGLATGSDNPVLCQLRYLLHELSHGTYLQHDDF